MPVRKTEKQSNRVRKELIQTYHRVDIWNSRLMKLSWAVPPENAVLDAMVVACDTYFPHSLQLLLSSALFRSHPPAKWTSQTALPDQMRR
jgi:hypothetical protein